MAKRYYAATNGLFPYEPYYFSGRHYRIIHLLDLEQYDPQSTVAELRQRLAQLEVKEAGLLCDGVLEQEDGDTAYLLTPLSHSELDELKRPFSLPLYPLENPEQES